MLTLFDPHTAQWWNEAPGPEMFRAYYMTLRVHYGMPAAEAFARAKQNAPALGIYDRGFIPLMRDAIRGRCPDCGEEGERAGHQTCQYPRDHA